MTFTKKTPRASFRLENLEDRLALSWAGVPPTQVSIPSSTVLTLNSNAFASGSASISFNENDYFSFTAPRSGAYQLDAYTPSSSVDTVLGVFNTFGQRLAYNDDISTSNTDSRVTVNLTAGQRYFFGITNYTGTSGGSYAWQVQGPQGGGGGGGDDSYEENDSINAASNLGTLTSRRTLSNLVMADSADWFRFTTSGAGTSSSSVSMTFSHAQGDLDLRLYDSAGNLVRYSDSASNSETVSLNGLAAGTYYVQVYGYNGARNPNYTLDVNPASGGGGGGSGRTLYLNFDGANISRTDLVRWAGSDWASSANDFDTDRNGISVSRFLPNRSDREAIISRVMQLVQEDLRPFGITVQRTTGLAVEGVGATTIFLGQSTLSNGYVHVACEVDQGNNNRTDIAFVGNEDWGTAERTAIAMADVTLHEAGHTYGLWHVQSGTALESMGLRYSISDQSRWVQNTSFLDRSFAAFVDRNGFPHGPGPQNAYRSMLAAFGNASNPAASSVALVDASRMGVFTVTTQSAGVDRVTIRRLASGNLELNVNGQIYELANGYRQINVYTSGDSRDEVRLLTQVPGVNVVVNRQAGAELRSISKGDARQANFWAGTRQDDDHNTGCGCSLCRGGMLMARDQMAGARPNAVVNIQEMVSVSELLQRRRTR